MGQADRHLARRWSKGEQDGDTYVFPGRAVQVVQAERCRGRGPNGFNPKKESIKKSRDRGGPFAKVRTVSVKFGFGQSPLNTISNGESGKGR